MGSQPGEAAKAQAGGEDHGAEDPRREPGNGHDGAEIGLGSGQGGSLSGVGGPGCDNPPTEGDSLSNQTFRSIIIGDRHVGKRLDAYLAARFPDWSRSALSGHIREGRVQSSLRKLKPSTSLLEGEELRVFIPGIAATEAPPPLPAVLYEDERLLVFDKPAGMLVHPAGDTFVWALVGLARAARPGARIDLVHRLDRETSGVVVLTKELEANRILKRALLEGQVRKEYLAVVRGQPDWEELDIDAPLGPSPHSEVKLRQAVVPGASPARTIVRVRQRMAAHTLVSCRILTGRTHQIRAHLEHVGFPLLGDKLYGQPDSTFLRRLEQGDDAGVRAATGFPRHALHAWKWAAIHPDGSRLFVEAPMPADLQAVVEGAPPCWPDPLAVEPAIGSAGALAGSLGYDAPAPLGDNPQ